uniref:CRIB domain-containing protein n=1 Tax=Acrobeloides nanus TaxID=290746 RepID=A0A914DTF1_9BILA
MPFIRTKSKRLKKTDISTPSNFEHRIHAVIDPTTGTLTGLPKQWHAFVGPAPTKVQGKFRPRPIIDPSTISSTEISSIKTIVRGDVQYSTSFYSRPYSSMVSTHNGNAASTSFSTSPDFITKINGNANGHVVPQQKQLSYEQFRQILASIVDPNDPRPHFEKFEQIGEGSTGFVMAAISEGVEPEAFSIGSKSKTTEPSRLI